MKVVLSLGSNLGRRFQTLQGAVDTLFDAPGLEFVRASRSTRPTRWAGPAGSARTSTRSWSPRPRSRRARCWSGRRASENAFGRVRAERWGPRTLDIDLIVVGETVCDDPDLTLPHRGRTSARSCWCRGRSRPGGCAARPRPVARLLEGLGDQGVRLRDDLKLQRPD
ncbi:2-amino-4-hydroxy-6-hydroxymethyldihydropteridinepyrophosphokinase [[Actinomadura] parvosata subsp. kistnae]|nr:2-amino-4-hydroxy-6-hydroxymethyldihydropteridinepyrophosphokinase [Actinomadura parvosata subsp. kistnae]